MPDQRTRILDATLTLMGREGSRGTSMRAVAAATGLNVASLYHYFPSKRDLCHEAIAHRLAVQGAFHQPFPEGLAGTVENRLGALLDDFFANMTAEADLWQVLLAEAIHGDDDVLQPLLDTERAVRSRARRLVAHTHPGSAGAARRRGRALDPACALRSDGRVPAATRNPARRALRSSA